jgi:nucleoid-associated protein YgaU
LRQIVSLNRTTLPNVNHIEVGQVLVIPGPPPLTPSNLRTAH